MKSLVDKLKNGVKKAIFLGSTLAFLTLPNLLKGQDIKVFSPKHVTAINPQGIVTGSVDLNDPKYNRISEEEIDASYRMKGSMGGWYGDQVVNPFISPGIRGAGTTDYYGSGDSDGDGNRDWDDIKYFVMNGKKNYRCDVNGNGIEGDIVGANSDDQLIGTFLDGQVSYLCSHWNYLNTQPRTGHDEKIEWFEKMVGLDDTNTFREGWGCGEYSQRFVLRFAGLENAEDYYAYPHINTLLDMKNENGKMNLPAYTVFGKAKDGQDHIYNAILVGDNPLEFEDWYFFEPQTDQRVFPGDFSMRAEEGDRVGIERLCYNDLADNALSYWSMPLVDFNLNKGINPTFYWAHPDIVTKHPGNPATGIENISLSQPDIIGKVYPNPYLGQSDLIIPYFGNGLEANVLVTDMLGRRVYEKPVKGAIEEIIISQDNFRNVASGYYNIIVGNKSGKGVSRIFIGR